MRRFKRECGLLLGISILVILSVAHTSLGIGIQPHRVEEEIPYGAIRYVEIALSNPGDVTKEVDISLAGVMTRPDGALVWLDSDGSGAEDGIYPYAGIGECVSLETNHLTLAPRSTEMLRLRITVPEALRRQAVAGRAGALWFDVADRGDNGALFDSVVRFIAFILITFEGAQQPEAELAVLDPSQNESGEVLLPVRIRNVGNIHLAPVGHVILRDSATGEVVDELTLPGGTVLPQCPREYAVVWRPDSTLDGAFTAEFVISFGEGVPNRTASIGFRVEAGVLVPESF